MQSEWKAFLTDAGAEFDLHNGEVRHFGMPEQEARMVSTGNVFADLSHLGLIGVSGEDARDFLHSQLTCDVINLSPQHSSLAGLCDPRGRLLAVARLFALDQNTLALSLPHALVASTLAHLQKYVLRARVSLEDISSRFIRLGVSGPDASRLLGEALGDSVSETVDTVAHCGNHPVLRLPGPQPRFELLLDAATAPRIWDKLNVHAAPTGSDAWQLLDHAAGLPIIHPETSGLFVAQTANLELVGGINFRKGCYPGQEVIARLQHRGRATRRMIRGRCLCRDRPHPGDPVFPAGKETQAMGHVMDARPDGDNSYALLMVVRLDALDKPDLHLQGADGPAVIPGELPYALGA